MTTLRPLPHFSQPGEPTHAATRCHNCNRFIRRSGWEYEVIWDERVVVWYVECAYCQATTKEERG